MSNQNTSVTVKGLFSQHSIQKRFEEILGKKAQGFMSSVLQVVGNNKLLSKADPQTILNAAATAASLDLPINQNLGFAWIVPYNNDAQFQLGARGYVQLALRTGQYQNINAIAVYENQFKSWDILTEDLQGDFSKDGEGNIVGYAAYFRLNNGFQKTVFWSMEKVNQHARRFSKSFNNGPWKTDFDAMAKKTVLKNTIAKWGILSIEMITAIEADQAVQRRPGDYNYPDNDQGIDIEKTGQEKEKTRILNHIETAKSITELQQVSQVLLEYDHDFYEAAVDAYEQRSAYLETLEQNSKKK